MTTCCFLVGVEKQEMTSVASSLSDAVERRIITKLTQIGQGVSLKDIQRDFRDVEPKLLSDAIRALVESRRASIQQVDGERYICVVNNLAEGLAVIFDLIRASGCEGIDQTTLCSKAKLSKSEVTKALNQLLTQQRIKDIRCFSNKAKKLYMLFELEPSELVTGGAFYNEQRDIDVGFVDSLRGRITAFVSLKKIVTLAQICQMIATEMPLKTLSHKEVSELVGTLEMDGVIECIHSQQPRSQQHFQLASGQNVTRHSAPGTIGSLVSQFPCVSCSLLDRCAPHGVGAINPSTCTYLEDWIRLTGT